MGQNVPYNIYVATADKITTKPQSYIATLLIQSRGRPWCWAGYPFNLFNWGLDANKDNAAKANKLVTKGYGENVLMKRYVK